MGACGRSSQWLAWAGVLASPDRRCAEGYHFHHYTRLQLLAVAFFKKTGLDTIGRRTYSSRHFRLVSHESW